MLAFMSELIDKFLSLVLHVLPKSPFKPYIAMVADIPYLGWLNWIFPVGACMKIMSAWLVAISLYYVYSLILRWLKLVGS